MCVCACVCGTGGGGQVKRIQKCISVAIIYTAGIFIYFEVVQVLYVILII